MEKKPVRIGLIGCGNIMLWHVENLLSRADARIAGLADPSPAAIERLVSVYPSLAGVPTFRSHQELLDSVELDAVQIGSPHTLHYANALAALERGLHVLCEKPLACESAHARDLIERAEARGLVLMVSYQRHFDPGYRYMKRVISEGGLGELQTVSVRCGQHWRKATEGSWRQKPELSGGGMLMDSGSHMVDVLLWLVDRPVLSVAGLVDTLGTPVDINSTATLQFAGGVQAQIQAIGDLPATWIEDVLVVGSEGILRYETDPQHPWRGGSVSHWRGKEQELVRPLGLDRDMSTDTNWLDAIAGAAECESPGRFGLQVALVTEAIYRSARKGAVVKLES